jgi:nucleotide-binding universal stress UspA family protein
MQTEILVPLDGSRLAEAALPHARAFARATGRRLRLLRVVSPGIGVAPLPPPEVLDSDADIHRQALTLAARSYLAGQGILCEEAGVRVETEVRVGPAVAAIVECAGENRAVELIIMATHGQTGLRHLLVGSTAEAVLHAAPVPVMLLHPPTDPAAQPDPAPGYRRILVPLDGSPIGEQAVAAARSLALACSAQLVLMGVVPNPHPATDWGSGVWDPKGRIHAYLSYLRTDLEIGGLRAETVVGYGNPAIEILRVARQQEVDLIVMATHGRSGLSRLVLGSVAAQVVQNSSQPVLLVRADEMVRPLGQPAPLVQKAS